jgi:hypothetical protein
VAPRSGSLFVHQFDRSLVFEQGIDDAITGRRVALADPEEYRTRWESMPKVARKRSGRLGRFKLALAEKSCSGKDRITRSRARVDPYDDRLRRVGRLERVTDRGGQASAVHGLPDSEHVRVRDQRRLRARREHGGDLIGDPIAGKKADGRNASLAQESRELMIEPGVPSHECDRSMSH